MLKRIICLVLCLICVLGMLTGCKEEEVPVVEVPEEEVKTYVFGVAGDMFREFVNQVSQGNWETAYSYIGLDENAIVSVYDVERYLMSLPIGNLLYMSYSTYDVVVAESGSVRQCQFKYVMSGKSNILSLYMNLKLIDNKWTVSVDDMTIRNGTLVVPNIDYKSIKVENYEVNLDKYTINDDGYRVYELPQISNYEKVVTIEDVNGNTYQTEFTWTYERQRNGKVTDDGSRKITLEDMNFTTGNTETVTQGNTTTDETATDTNNSGDAEISDEVVVNPPIIVG